MSSYPDYLPVSNGIVDLRTGTLVENTQDIDESEFTSRVNAVWTSLDMPTPVIDAFMNDIMLSNEQLIAHLQKVLGYCITGHRNEHKFVALIGTGSNGKSTLVASLHALMNDFCRTCPSDILTKPLKPTPELASLIGPRLIVASALYKPIKVATVKELVSESMFLVKPLYEGYTKGYPQFKLLVTDNTTNNIMPHPVDPGLAKRAIVIPFNAYFVNEAHYDSTNISHKLANPNILDTLNANLDQLLVWLVKGAIAYNQEGLDTDMATI